MTELEALAKFGRSVIEREEHIKARKRDDNRIKNALFRTWQECDLRFTIGEVTKNVPVTSVEELDEAISARICKLLKG